MSKNYEYGESYYLEITKIYLVGHKKYLNKLHTS